MSKLEEFNQLKRELDVLFSSKEIIEKQICDKASKIYKLNSECISLSNNNGHERQEFKELCLEVCNYISNVLQVRLNSDGLMELKYGKSCDKGVTEVQDSIEAVQQETLNTEDNLCENKKSTIHANNYAFKNVYKLDDFMNTTNWLWNKELKSKIVDAASNRDIGLHNIVQSPQIGGDFSSITLGHSKMQCNVLPKLVCKTVKVEESSLEQIRYMNPLKSYIEKAFKLE